jgi:hypothetical protein
MQIKYCLYVFVCVMIYKVGSEKLIRNSFVKFIWSLSAYCEDVIYCNTWK